MADTSVMRLELAPSLDEVSVARRFVRNLLNDVTDSVRADAQLITSELVTNAVEHGTGGPVLIAVERSGDEVAVTVESVGPAPGVGDVGEWNVAPAEQITGRGLGIVRAVADRVQVDRTGRRLVITACLTF